MSFRSSLQRASARLSSVRLAPVRTPWPGRPRAWLIALALLVAMPGAAQAACGTMNVPDGYTTP